ncbi:VOC family protein [Aureimonas fodinaquatilis]|uniref:VOC family protein n=1 Tax=Aureimonas fodinaquatilis TaxID=2565783 RepID=A0A5B0E297_9HYPH|nr:VOC family protein [Aureimonas fodinaquatilis]KAA0972081.1 VOC family protein [Aureimonas fodinaquatilis]
MPPVEHSSEAPLSIGKVALAVREPDLVAAFYRNIVGLADLGKGDEGILLGAGNVPLLELVARPNAKPDDPREAGLFHTAFLLPDRRDLAEWAAEVGIRRQTAIEGASDHIVSEAFYLTDPEGNGVEIYADRPAAEWNWVNGQVEMATKRLDMNGLLNEVDLSAPDWEGAPEDTVIGHIHLRVGDLAESDKFYLGDAGFELATTYPGAHFLSTGGYHHHIGTNVWHSGGSGPRQDRTGLLWFEVLDKRDGAKAAELTDPWGTPLRFVTPS